MVDTCPPECKVKINGINTQITELKDTDKKQWEIFDQKIHNVEALVFDRVKSKTLIALFGVVVTVFLAIMALTFTSLSSGQKQTVKKLESYHSQSTTQMNKIEREMVKVVTELENHTERHDGDSG